MDNDLDSEEYAGGDWFSAESMSKNALILGFVSDVTDFMPNVTVFTIQLCLD